MKVKLVKVYYEHENCCDDYVKRMFVETMSGWEDLTQSKFEYLQEFAEKYNNKHRKGDDHKYLILTEVPYVQMHLGIEQQMAAEALEEKRLAKKEAEYKHAQEIKEMNRKLKRELREQAQFEKLSKKFAKRQPDASGASTL